MVSPQHSNPIGATTDIHIRTIRITMDHTIYSVDQLMYSTGLLLKPNTFSNNSPLTGNLEYIPMETVTRASANGCFFKGELFSAVTMAPSRIMRRSTNIEGKIRK